MAILTPRQDFASAPTWAGWIAISVGLVVLLGWLLDVGLRSMIPDVLDGIGADGSSETTAVSSPAPSAT